MALTNRAATACLGVGVLLAGLFPLQAVAQTDSLSASRRTLSVFEMEKARRLLSDKLPCLGCHELEGEGGRVGPSLSRLAETRPPDYVFSMIRDPQGTVPGTVMPRIPLVKRYTWTASRYDFIVGEDGERRLVTETSPLVETTLELIGNFLLQREPSDSRPPDQLPRADPIAPDEQDGAVLYGHYCAVCHGEGGHGDGPNARYLPTPPVSHADPDYMSKRPDDSLFDAIFAGGYIMDRSPRMPPYGRTLSREQIWSLVRYLRELCQCQGPAWSSDGQ